MIKEIFKRIHWWRTTDRVGPDIPWTHLLLYFPKAAKKLCKRKFAHFGENAEFRPGAYAVNCSRIRIGARVVIRPLTLLDADAGHTEGTITIEDDVLIGMGVHIYTTDHEFLDRALPIIAQGHRSAAPVTVKTGSWIGANVILLPGVTIGRNCVIGAGSIVTKSIPDFSVAVGNPAMVIRVLSGAVSEGAGSYG